MRNASILLAITMLTDAVTVPYMGLLARRLGVAGFGTYSVAVSFVTIAVMVIDAGTGKLLTRELSAHETEAPSIVTASLLPKPALTLITLLIALLIAHALGHSGAPANHVALAILIAAMMALATAARAVFHAFQRMEFDAVGEVTERVVTIGLSIAAVLAGYGVVGVLVAMFFGNLADALASWFLVRRHFVRRLARANGVQIKRYLRMGFPLLVTALFSTLYLRANVVILGSTSGNSAAGIFNAAFQLLTLALYIPTVLGVAIFPYFSRLAHADARTLARATRYGALAMACAGLVAALALILAAGWLVPLIYSSRFVPSVTVLHILALGLPFTFTSALLQQVLIATNRQGIVGRATVYAAVINLALNVLLDRSLGTTGAAYVAAGTELILALQYLYAAMAIKGEEYA
jgi:O-antigen/teichoic acid export membrane protein